MALHWLEMLSVVLQFLTNSFKVAIPVRNVTVKIVQKQDISEDEKLCVYLVEKALRKLQPGQEQMLGIIDLHGFSTENADLKFLSFLIYETLYSQFDVLLLLSKDAPFIFKPIWQLVKPALRSYASLVKFCSAKTAINEYFTLGTVPQT
ncbi:OLC1v1030770C1 [Oldenlandia corymbosa var. corymbosa]|uniref:OLC1v1030770C1 n=1 Tax=Oldenlandia corymbosa var. corymbosa TaxID=529605 RepID=A0AAV1CIU0_OLDCO|nr:OLC1v1030770C1 [Oldenlandia corymbosa var. corymbosa]